MRLALVLLCTFVCGCGNCNPVHNPVSSEYPCGTRAHACSTAPLSCCWNDLVCGGEVGSGCPAGMCCYGGDSFAARQDGGNAAPSRQWQP
ncbi:MAG: hypothetical protein WC683_02130 [bacterium]